MPEMFDAVPLEGVRITKDGYLVADARVARTGVQEYTGREVGKPDMALVRLYRSADEVFSEDAMASFAHRPVTNGHPRKAVDASTWKAVARGHTDGNVVRDGSCLRVPMMLADKATIEAVQAGKRELSAGYTCDIDWTAGTTPDGVEYDGLQTQIRGNHIAIVTKGRAGPECRIGDNFEEERDMKIVIIDGVSLEVADESAVALETLGSRLTEATRLADSRAGEIDALNAAHVIALAGVQALVLDTAAMDAAILSRLAVVDSARKIIGNGFDAAGKSDAEIRRTVVRHRIGDARVEGKSDDYVVAAFDALTHDVKAADPLAKALASAVVRDAAPVRTAYQEYVSNMETAHLNINTQED